MLSYVTRRSSHDKVMTPPARILAGTPPARMLHKTPPPPATHALIREHHSLEGLGLAAAIGMRLAHRLAIGAPELARGGLHSRAEQGRVDLVGRIADGASSSPPASSFALSGRPRGLRWGRGRVGRDLDRARPCAVGAVSRLHDTEEHRTRAIEVQRFPMDPGEADGIVGDQSAAFASLAARAAERRLVFSHAAITPGPSRPT